ncbi:DUF488 family protein [Pseudactinotalea sp. Z1739]|uniref:DUF488 domain-containing protein n=1 Tax=Pseudactinotalea sp. Z1739 TaxID=3413028 RepID=UPI003C7C8E17
MPLLTVGHGALSRAELRDLLIGAEVESVVDVRRFPGSRRNPDVGRDALASWLPEAGIGYRWEEHLGGRRHLTRAAQARSPDTWWQVAAFRAYAGYTRTEEFRAALTRVVQEARAARVAVMCSESVWWRCHRRIIADVTAMTTDVPVLHLMHDGAVRAHPPSEGARAGEDGLVWDVPGSVGAPSHDDEDGAQR